MEILFLIFKYFDGDDYVSVDCEDGSVRLELEPRHGRKWRSVSGRVSICGQSVPRTSAAVGLIEAMMRCGRTHVSTPHQTNKSNQSRKLFAHFPNLIHYSGHAIVAPAGSNLDNIMRGEIGGSINTINSRTALRSTYHPSNSMGEAP